MTFWPYFASGAEKEIREFETKKREEKEAANAELGRLPPGKYKSDVLIFDSGEQILIIFGSKKWILVVLWSFLVENFQN